MEPNKGKPVATSVPSISIKFHANIEEIEEFRFSDDDSALDNSQLQLVTKNAGEDSSPLKLLPKSVKRSTSVDVSADQSLSSSPPSDPWRFFNDIKGKITKSVEEKLTEIKAKHEEGSPLHRAKDRKSSKEKDNSSLSDSEDQSESSISRTCGFASTTEGVEMSSDEETSSIDKEKQVSKGVVRQRFRFLKSQNSPPTEGTVNINHLSKLYNINTDKVEQALRENLEEVESGVDALEEADFSDGLPGKNEILSKVAEKYDNIDVSKDDIVTIRQLSGDQIPRGNSKMTTVFAPTGFVDFRSKRSLITNTDTHVFLSIVLSIYVILYAIFHTYLPYMAGMLLGASLALIFGYIYMKLYTIPLNIPDSFDFGRIVEGPSIKEHQPLTKYEGWLNEYPETYNPILYHISRTQSVFLRLQGNLLRISHSKTKVPKRAMWNESEIKAVFNHHRIYNLVGAKISLLPEGLAKIRLWSKKYPICITLNKDQMNFVSAVAKQDLEQEESEKSSPKPKKTSIFKKRDPSFLAQRFSKLAEDQDVDMDSDSRASTPSPVQSELPPEPPVEIVDDEMYSCPDESTTDNSQNSGSEIKIYLFGRTDREKEDWFRRLALATHSTESEESKNQKIEDDYLKYMILFNKTLRKGSSQVEDKPNSETESDLHLWFNALIGRVLFDAIRNPHFVQKVQNRIQKKLQTIKLPYFIEEILITELNLGKTPPFIVKTEKPILNDRGLWVDLDITYTGSVVLTLQTKLNLMKLKTPQLDRNSIDTKKSAIYHSDVDDTAESSSDEDGPQEVQVMKEGERPSGSKKFIKMVDRITESKLFQAATDNRYIKKAMEGVSNTELRLTVEMKALSGTVVLNVPPPPSDRIWLGFRPVPQLVLTACPIVGDRNLTYTMVTNWIEKKMLQEFQKVMVIPNMEDFLVPVMLPNLPE